MAQKDKFRIAIRKFEPFESAVEKIWEAFCQKSGCPLVLDAVAVDLHPLYDSIFKNNYLKNGDWDVAFLNTDWITEAVENNHIENLNPFIAAQNPKEFLAGWAPSMLNMQTFEGKIYGLPLHNGPECLIYRKDLFESPAEQLAYEEKFDRKLRVPQTWDDFRDVAGFFHRPDENLFGTVFAAYPDGHNTVFDFYLQLWTRGGELTADENRVIVNSRQALEGMRYYRSMLQHAAKIHPGSRDFDSVKAGMAFADGQVAMMVNWFGFASMCEVYPASRVKGKVDIANVPAGPTGKGISLNAYWMYVLGTGCTQKDIAYDFMRFAVNPSNDKLLTLEGGIGCRKSTWHDPEVNSEVPYYHKLEALHKNTRALPQMSNWSEIATEIDQLVLEVINTDKDISEILDEAQDQIDNKCRQMID